MARTRRRARRNPSTPRIYVASLSDYNAGHLHGAWIDADSDVDVMAAQVADMLAESRHQPAEDYAIHDHEGFPVRIGEFTSLQEIATIMEAIEAVEDRVGRDPKAVQAVMAALDDAGYDPMEWPRQVEGVSLYGPFDGLYPEEELSLEMVSDFGSVQDLWGKQADFYFDHARFGRDARISGDLDDPDHDEDDGPQWWEDLSDREIGEHIIDEWYGGDVSQVPHADHYFDHRKAGRDLAMDYQEVRTGPMEVWFVRVP